MKIDEDQNRNELTPPTIKRMVWPVLVITVAALLRFAHLIFVHDSILLEPRGFLDDAFFYQLGIKVSHGDLMLGSEPFFLAPLYTYFLGLVYALLPTGVTAPFIIQAALGVVATWLVYRAGRAAWGELAGLVAAALLGLDGLAAMYSCALLPAALDPFLSALFFYAVIKAIKLDGWWRWALVGALGGAFALNRPNALALVPIVALAPLALRLPHGWLRAVAVVVSALCVIAPVTIRNLAASGDLVLISAHGGLNFYIGNSRGATGFYRSPPWMSADVRGQKEETRRYLEWSLGREVGAGEVSGLFYRMAFSEVADDPGAWFALLFKKTLCMLSGREAGLNLSLGYMREACSRVLWLLPVGSCMLLPLAAMGAIGWRRNGEALVVVALILVYAVTVVAFFISDRYRLPLHPPLALLAGAGVSGLYRAVRDRRRRELALPLLGFGIFLATSFYNPGVASGDGQMRLMHALRLIEDGRPEEAREVAAGMPAGQMNPFYWRQKLARAYQSKGWAELAEAEYLTLLELAPELGLLRCRLAQLYFSRGLNEEGARELRLGLRHSPEDEVCHEVLARSGLAP